MILGLGHDVCAVSRMEKLCCNERFTGRVFVSSELESVASCVNRAERLAGFYAAREAFAKASGLGLARVGLKSVWVDHDDSGRPLLKVDFSRPCLTCFRDCRVFLSISHDGGIASAVVVIERC